jgi:hypothetical protein
MVTGKMKLTLSDKKLLLSNKTATKSPKKSINGLQTNLQELMGIKGRLLLDIG